MFTVVDADVIGRGDSLKAHNGGYKAKVNGTYYKNVHMDWSKYLAYVVEGDDEVAPKAIFNQDGSVNYQHTKPAVFVVTGTEAKERNLFAQLKPGDVVVNGDNSVMSVTDDVKKAYECDAMLLFFILFF